MTAAAALHACAICGGAATIVDESPDLRDDEAWCHQHVRPTVRNGFKRVHLDDRRIANKGGFS